MKNTHAVELGKLRMASMSKKRKSKHQREAALAKWKRWRELKGKE